MKVHFHLKDPKASKDTLIYLTLYYKGKRIKLSTGLSIHPDLWNASGERARKVTGHSENASLNINLDKYESIARDEYHKAGSAEQLRSGIQDRMQQNVDQVTLFTYMEDIIKHYKAMGKSHKSMHTTLGILRKFSPGLTFEDINMMFYRDLTGFMMKMKYSKNYIGRQVANIKTLMGYALEDGITDNHKFKSNNFKRTSEKVYNIYNTVEELIKIYHCDLSDVPGVDKARDLYLISAFTGLRFSDYKTLSAGNFTGGQYIVQDMRKVSGRVVVPLHWIVRKVLEKYGGELPTAPSNQKMNKHIKTFGERAEIKEQVLKTRTQGGKVVQTSYFKYQLMTTHTARRSMATNMYLAGIPLFTISKMLGHSNVKQTIDYIKVTELEISQSLISHPFFLEQPPE